MKIIKNNKLEVDASKVSKGYFRARYIGKSNDKLVLKLQVESVGMKLNYNLNVNGEFETFPLQLGSGKYRITLYRKVVAIRYAKIGQVVVYVNLKDQNEVYLHYNQYVPYHEKLSDIARSLSASGDKRDAYRNIVRYVNSAYVYDYVKASKVKPNVLPDVKRCYEKKMGICQDLAALVATMFRSIGIPAKLMIGTVVVGRSKYYHAWADVLIDGKWERFDYTWGASSKDKTYIVERWY